MPSSSHGTRRSTAVEKPETGRNEHAPGCPRRGSDGRTRAPPARPPNSSTLLRGSAAPPARDMKKQRRTRRRAPRPGRRFAGRLRTRQDPQPPRADDRRRVDRRMNRGQDAGTSRHSRMRRTTCLSIVRRCTVYSLEPRRGQETITETSVYAFTTPTRTTSARPRPRPDLELRGAILLLEGRKVLVNGRAPWSVRCARRASALPSSRVRLPQVPAREP